MKGKQSQIKNKIERRFLKSPKGRLVLNLKHKKLEVAYMYGFKYSLIREKEGRKSVLFVCDELDKIVKQIEEEKINDQSDKMKRLKSISKFKK